MRRHMMMGLIGGILLAGAVQAGLLAPWDEPFDTDPALNPDYVIGANGDATWTYNSISDQLIADGNSGSNGGGNYWFSGAVANLGDIALTDFHISLNVYSSSKYNQINLSALGPAGWSTGYLVYFRSTDQSLDLRRGANSGDNQVATSTGTIKETGDYIFTLSGHYNDEKLDLTAVITDSLDQSIILNWTDDTPLSGQVFGVGGRVVSNNTVKLNSLSVVPEPMTMSLFGFCGLGILCARRLFN